MTLTHKCGSWYCWSCSGKPLTFPPMLPQTCSVSFPGFPIPDLPGSRRFFHSRFPGKLVRDSREYDLLSKFVYSSGISGIFHQMLRICLRIHNYVHATSCKEPRCIIWCQTILHFIFAFGRLQSSLPKALESLFAPP
jgi:hypothetical protein